MRDRDAVSRFESAEVPPLHGAGEAAADGNSGDVDLLSGNEVVGQNDVAHFEQIRAVDAEFRELALRFDLGLCETPAVSLAEPLRFRKAGAELYSSVAVFLFRPLAHDLAAVKLQDRDRYVPPVFEEETGHADLLRDDACAHPPVPILSRRRRQPRDRASSARRSSAAWDR